MQELTEQTGRFDRPLLWNGGITLVDVSPQSWTATEQTRGNSPQNASNLFNPNLYEELRNLRNYQPNNQSTLVPSSGDLPVVVNNPTVGLLPQVYFIDSSREIANLSAAQLAAWSQDAVRALNREQIQLLDRAQVASVATNLSREQVSYLSPDQISRLPVIDRNLISHMNREQLSALTPEQRLTAREFFGTQLEDLNSQHSSAPIGAVTTVWLSSERTEANSDARREAILRNSMLGQLSPHP